MTSMLTQNVWPVAGEYWRRPQAEDDPLDAIRGILFGTLASIVGFWIPLAYSLTH